MQLTNNEILSKIKSILEKYGFNLFGSVNTLDYDLFVNRGIKISQKFPEYKSLILFGSGGKNFWEILKIFKNKPEGIFLNSSDNPIDDYTEFCLEKIQKEFPDIIDKLLYPFKSDDLTINYQQLAVFSGIGHLSPYLGLVLHPEYGSWISLRGAFLSKYEFPATSPLLSPVPCLNCEKPCLSACPVMAIDAEGMDFKKCFDYRNEEQDCKSHCNVRKECIIGKEHIYTQEEGFHRNKSSLESMRNYYL